MELKRIFGGDTNCAGSACPTIYETENGDFVIQGYIIPSDTKEKIGLPLNEDAIRLPRNFIQDFINSK